MQKQFVFGTHLISIQGQGGACVWGVGVGRKIKKGWGCFERLKRRNEHGEGWKNCAVWSEKILRENGNKIGKRLSISKNKVAAELRDGN